MKPRRTSEAANLYVQSHSMNEPSPAASCTDQRCSSSSLTIPNFFCDAFEIAAARMTPDSVVRRTLPFLFSEVRALVEYDTVGKLEARIEKRAGG
jgi:hypothetical protein